MIKSGHASPRQGKPEGGRLGHGVGLKFTEGEKNLVDLFILFITEMKEDKAKEIELKIIP